jgi:hypothetical protein
MSHRALCSACSGRAAKPGTIVGNNSREGKPKTKRVLTPTIMDGKKYDPQEAAEQ